MRILSQQIPADEKKNKKLLREMVTDNYRDFIPERSGGKEETQILVQVYRLLVRIYSGGKSDKVDDKTLRQVIGSFRAKRSRNRLHAG